MRTRRPRPPLERVDADLITRCIREVKQFRGLDRRGSKGSQLR
jgi:hypothetical protein